MNINTCSNYICSPANYGGDLIVDFPRKGRLAMVSPNESPPRPSDSSTNNKHNSDKSSTSSTSSDESTKSSSTQQRVRFLESSTALLIHYPTQDQIRQCWYSSSDKDRLKSEFRRDIRIVSRKLAVIPVKHISQEDLFECIGMENMLSLQVYTLSKLRKRNHLRSVLEAQARHDQRISTAKFHGEDELQMRIFMDEEELSQLSQRNSEWTVTRAHKLAEGYWLRLQEQEDQVSFS